MIIIGESLNATRKAVRAAVIDHDVDFVQALAKEQVACGANMLDVNAAVAGRKEVEDLPWLVQVVQEVVDVPLVLDSADPDALIAAIKVHRGRPMVNSISAESDKIEKLVPVVSRADCSVIVLCMDDGGIPIDVEGRLKAGRAAIEPLLKAGKKKEDLFVDPLVMAISVDANAARTTLEVIRSLGEGEFAGVNITGGLSNISFGMPGRSLLNRVFMTMAINMGLNSCITDVRDQALMSTIYASLSLFEQSACRDYIKKFRQGLLVV
ncbi:dihydropteroate synthase [Phosphitispora sp. TUW77]|uniref:dihydropteroate synthase n=1 Tax=Phosphitispora sp. TUW77 TaxID=3152361 RepID=UPI003AB3B2C1